MSTRVSRRSGPDCSVTSIRSTFAGSTPSSSGRCPSNGSGFAEPSRSTSSARSGEPKRYQIGTSVHSPAAVGATRRPTSAFTSVDFPVLTRPTTATRSGSVSVARSAATSPCARGTSRRAASSHSAAVERHR